MTPEFITGFFFEAIKTAILLSAPMLLSGLAVGLLVSRLDLDASPKVGKIAAGVRVLAGLACFLLPHTPPRATGRPPTRRCASSTA